MIPDIWFMIGIYLPNRSCTTLSRVNRFCYNLFTSDTFWKEKLRDDDRFDTEAGYSSYINYQRRKRFLNNKAVLYNIKISDVTLQTSIVEYGLTGRVHPWLEVSASSLTMSRGDILSIVDIDIDDGCKYIYSGYRLEPLLMHPDGSMIVPSSYSVIKEFPIYYWSNIFKHTYIPLNIINQEINIKFMNSYSYIKVGKDNIDYYIILYTQVDKLKSIILHGNIHTYMQSCYYTYIDPHPEINKINTGRRKTLYVIEKAK